MRRKREGKEKKENNENLSAEQKYERESWRDGDKKRSPSCIVLEDRERGDEKGELITGFSPGIIQNQ